MVVAAAAVVRWSIEDTFVSVGQDGIGYLFDAAAAEEEDAIEDELMHCWAEVLALLEMPALDRLH